ncbi:unnamed protein product [Phaedon cochleariae]|uniref:Peptidase S1 domain-containing protein n=1 Tax=Phaedon cochleariae TaxID=80249 RepID=A0A9P0GIA4_PHACE|nr:unnamed protein product [Phaedon cochleariae]
MTIRNYTHVQMGNYFIIAASLLLNIISISCQELISPCPRLFTYEPRNPNEPDKWYGRISLLSDSDLSGVWLRIILDKKSIQLGNWFGEVKTDDNKEYLIKNRQKQLKANVPDFVRFYIKHDMNEPPPRLTGFRLNAKMVCPEGGLPTEPTTPPQQWFTSAELTTTPAPVVHSVTTHVPDVAPSISEISEGTEPFVRPPSNENGNTEEDDFFTGDFSFFGKPQKPLFDESTCGTVIKQPRPLITYGQVTQEGEFPWHAALYHARGIDLSYICGGTLISRYHIVTVAHCVTRRSVQSTLNPSSLVVYLGKFYLKVWSNPGIQDRQVERIFVHERYNSHAFKNDIAVLKLSTPIEITDYVRPACLWEEQQTLEAVIGKLGTVVGWGFDENGKVTEQLTKAHMPVVSQETCIYSFPDFYSRFTSDHTYCAGFKNGKAPENASYAIQATNSNGYFNYVVQMFRFRYSPGFTAYDITTGTSVCNGDSGGGMVFPKRGSNPNNPIWQLRGMVSISVALQNQVRCDSSHYVVFTDTAKYLDWIKKALRS